MSKSLVEFAKSRLEIEKAVPVKDEFVIMLCDAVIEAADINMNYQQTVIGGSLPYGYFNVITGWYKKYAMPKE